VAGIIYQAMLATSCDSIQHKKRGSTMWRMTWQALSVRQCKPLTLNHLALTSGSASK